MIAIDGQLVADARSLGMTRLEAEWLAERAWGRSLHEINTSTGQLTAVGIHDQERAAYWATLATHLPADD